MSATLTNHIPDFGPAHAKATDDALMACGALLETALVRAHRGGYTSGRFSAMPVGKGGLLVRQYIKMGQPVTEDGVRVIRVGIRGTGKQYVKGQKTPATIGQIALAWELGHMNTFTRKHERSEKWRPTATDMIPKLRQTYQAVYTARLKFYLGRAA